VRHDWRHLRHWRPHRRQTAANAGCGHGTVLSSSAAKSPLSRRSSLPRPGAAHPAMPPGRATNRAGTRRRDRLPENLWAVADGPGDYLAKTGEFVHGRG
jgi:hypothetical protein